MLTRRVHAVHVFVVLLAGLVLTTPALLGATAASGLPANDEGSPIRSEPPEVAGGEIAREAVDELAPGSEEGREPPGEGTAPASSQTGPTWFLQGEVSDQLTKTQEPQPEGCCTFDTGEPDDGDTAVQSTVPVANSDFAENPFAAFWTGPFSGTLDGNLELTWWWTSANAEAAVLGAAVEVTVFADAPEGGGVATDAIVGREEVRLAVGPTPTENTNVVPVDGTVGDRLTIQVVPIFVDTGLDLRVLYGSADTPSHFRQIVGSDDNVTPDGVDGLPSADPQGLAFSASVPADIQRDEGEPLIEIDNEGRIYTCGPTGFSQVNDYAQVSEDGGDQFHLLGEPPRGQLSVGEGGGDCSLATSPIPNADGFHQVAYTGLGPLANFTAGTSADGGHTFTVSPISESVPGVDRQWNTFLDEQTVLLNYNQLAPRQVVVQKSTDGGLTYGPRVPATPLNPSFPGPLRTLPAEFNPTGAENGPVAYFPWNQGTNINLAISTDRGDTWQVCEAAEAPGQPALFVVADHDQAGNLYLAYSDDQDFHVWLTTLQADRLAACDQVVGEGDDDPVTVNPGWSTPVQVDRDGVRSAVFPWIAAGGEPGRVAVTFYGSTADGNPGEGVSEDSPGFQGAWDVYVNQSLNALDADATFGQVKATTHPLHYDQICLGGVGCTGAADRSLVDFFAIDHNPSNGELVVVYNRAHKRPGDALGLVSTPVVTRQSAGPSNSGGMVDRDAPALLRTASTDPTDDAITDYSSLYTPPTPTMVPAADLLGHEVGPFVDLETGEVVEDSGFTATIEVADLSDEALEDALSASRAQSLLWIFRFVDGYRYSAASARWSPGDGFTFGFNGYVGTLWDCDPATATQDDGDQCLLYPGDTPIPGAVDQDAGTITLSIPIELLSALTETTDEHGRPDEVAASPGDRIHDASAFTAANPFSPTQDLQSFLEPLDNTPAMDFLIPEPRQIAPALSINDVTGDEGTGGRTEFTFTVTAAPPPDEPATVSYRTEEGTARAGADFKPVKGTLTLPAATTEATITVHVVADGREEPDETFSVVLSDPVNATIADGEGTGTIRNDDTPGHPPERTTLASSPSTDGPAAFAVALGLLALTALLLPWRFRRR